MGGRAQASDDPLQTRGHVRRPQAAARVQRRARAARAGGAGRAGRLQRGQQRRQERGGGSGGVGRLRRAAAPGRGARGRRAAYDQLMELPGGRGQASGARRQSLTHVVGQRAHKPCSGA